MTNDNQDALRCADDIHSKVPSCSPRAAAHLRRLVAQNDAKDALLRQAVEALEADRDQMLWPFKITTMKKDTLAAIRQHLEGRA